MTNFKSTSDEWHTRCGRCAFLLPDDTMTFCPMCGVPFSKVQPTQSYLLLSDRETIIERKRALGLKSAFSFVLMMLVMMSYVFYKNYQLRFRYHQVTQSRAVIFYNYQNSSFNSLDNLAVNKVVQDGIQAFHDHFSWEISQYSVLHDSLPDAEVEGFLSTTLSIDFYKWQKFVLEKHYRKFQNNPLRPLPVIITNIPISISNEQRSFVAESRHLADSGLIGGLANPGIVVVSTYKALNNDTLSNAEKFKIETKLELHRVIAEYFLAHELGHALVGLKDFVVNPVFSDKVPMTRLPASAFKIQEQCLMHTVFGGGGQSWEKLRKRSVSNKSTCELYDPLLEAYELREKAFSLRIKGSYQEAKVVYQQAIDKANGLLQENLMTLWIDDQEKFF